MLGHKKDSEDELSSMLLSLQRERQFLCDEKQQNTALVTYSAIMYRDVPLFILIKTKKKEEKPQWGGKSGGITILYHFHPFKSISSHISHL